jgi:hypothetical protein
MPCPCAEAVRVESFRDQVIGQVLGEFPELVHHRRRSGAVPSRRSAGHRLGGGEPSAPEDDHVCRAWPRRLNGQRHFLDSQPQEPLSIGHAGGRRFPDGVEIARQLLQRLLLGVRQRG